MSTCTCGARFHTNAKPFAIADIQAAVAQQFRVPVSSMRSQSRAYEIARPRLIAMYLSRELTGRSLGEIGRMFGGRHHTTVQHAITEVRALLAVCPQLHTSRQAVLARLRDGRLAV